MAVVTQEATTREEVLVVDFTMEVATVSKVVAHTVVEITTLVDTTTVSIYIEF